MVQRPLDTSPEALERQRIALEKLGPEARVRAAIEMSESMRRVTLAGLRADCPDASEEALVTRFVDRVHGVQLDSSG
jgi:hypothetical protein